MFIVKQVTTINDKKEGDIINKFTVINDGWFF